VTKDKKQKRGNGRALYSRLWQKPAFGLPKKSPTGLATRSALAAESSAHRTAFLARLGLGLVHAHGAPVEFMAVESVDRCLRLRGVRHRDKTKTLAATGHAIRHNANGGNFAELRERRL
jgi:hypothetical protein